MTAYKVLGIGRGGVDTENDEMQFELSIDGRPAMNFIAGYGAATQITRALGRMFFELQRILLEKKAMKPVGGEKIGASHIQRDRWKNQVIMQLTTPEGIPYTFVMPPQIADEIANQLKTESAKPHQTGHA
jgi:hypothetical protein